MKRKMFFTGSIFQFHIREINKYSFCKFLDFTHISPFQGLLAKVFNKFSDDETVSLDELARAEWLFGERIMISWPNLRKDSGWKYIGILNSATDDEIPAFKGVQAFPYIVEDNYSIGPWYPVFDFNTRGKDCAYDCVRHLESKILNTAWGIECRAGMEYCRMNNIDVNKYYDLGKEEVLHVYWEMINTPIYNTIPQSIRGKVSESKADSID